jgi:hypothetical protein
LSKDSSFFSKIFFIHFHHYSLQYFVLHFHYNYISIMAFFPLFYIKLDPNTKLGTLNEGLYVMTSQNNLTDTGVLIGLSISPYDRMAQLVLVPEHHTPRNPHAAFPSREYIANIQLTSPNHLLEWLSRRQHPVNLAGTAPGSIEELMAARQWFYEVARDLKSLKV